jgi:hypothetical protein
VHGQWKTAVQVKSFSSFNFVSWMTDHPVLLPHSIAPSEQSRYAQPPGLGPNYKSAFPTNVPCMRAFIGSR